MTALDEFMRKTSRPRGITSCSRCTDRCKNFKPETYCLLDSNYISQKIFTMEAARVFEFTQRSEIANSQIRRRYQ